MGKRRKFSGESKREAVQMTMVPFSKSHLMGRI